MQIITLGILVWIAVELSGQQQTNIQNSTVEGMVVEAATGRPIPDAQVSTDRSGPREYIRTDNNGRFKLSGVPPGLRSIIVRKQGYATARKVGQWRSAALVQVEGGEPVQGVSIPLVRGGAISGRVQADDRVGLARYTYGLNGDLELRLVEAVRAANGLGNAGEYQFDGLEAGEYYVFISPFLRSSPKGETFPITYYPGTLYLSAASAIAVKPGTSVRLSDFTMSSIPAPSVRLRLVNATGNPETVKGCATVSWKRRGSPDGGANEMTLCSAPTSTEALSRLNMGALAPGIYDIYAGWQGTNPSGAIVDGATASFEVRNVNLEVEVVISHARLTGRLMLERPDGSFVPAAGLEFTLNPLRAGPAIWAETGSDGSFQYDQVLRGEYTPEISPLPPDAYVAQLTEGDRNVLRDGLEVRSTSLYVNGIISSRGAQVQGSVTDSKNQKAPGSIVALVPDPPLRTSHHLYRMTVTNHNGDFTIRAIAPGAYRLFAWSQLDGAAYENAEFMKTYEDRGKPVLLDKGGRVAIEATLLDEPAGR